MYISAEVYPYQGKEKDDGTFYRLARGETPSSLRLL